MDERRSTVLVVDDTEANVDILVGVLDDAYEVSVAMDGESALEAVRDDPPDLILLDIMMPGMDVIELVRHMRAVEEKPLEIGPVERICADRHFDRGAGIRSSLRGQ